MTLTLQLKIKPQAHQSFRFARNGRRYKPKKIIDYQNNLRKLVKEQLPNKFEIVKAGSIIIVNYILSFISIFINLMLFHTNSHKVFPLHLLNILYLS